TTPPPPLLSPYTTLFRSRRLECGPKADKRSERKCDVHAIAAPDARAVEDMRPAAQPPFPARGWTHVFDGAGVRRGDRVYVAFSRSEEHTSELQSLTNLLC